MPTCVGALSFSSSLSDVRGLYCWMSVLLEDCIVGGVCCRLVNISNIQRHSFGN